MKYDMIALKGGSSSLFCQSMMQSLVTKLTYYQRRRRKNLGNVCI